MSVLDRISAAVAGLLPSWARWDIADRMNRSPRQCWADLVSWAMRDPRDDPDWRSDLPSRPIGETCRKDAEHTGRCYCGKLAADGVVLRAGEKVCVTRMPGRDDRWCSRPNGHDGLHRCAGAEWGRA